MTLDWDVNLIYGEVLTSQGRVLRPQDDDGAVAKAFSEFMGPKLSKEEHLGQCTVEEPYSKAEAAETVHSTTV